MNYANAFLLVLGGTIVGFMVESLQLMAAERDRAQREAAAAAERARLARAVHDGVLQVLALVQRRGAELGGDGAELGRLAGEQEVALRTLIRSQDAVSARDAAGLGRPHRCAGRAGSRPGVHVATPGTAVEVPAAVGTELVAAVGACLDNVAVHVGAGAHAPGCCSRRSPTGSRCRCATRGRASPRAGSARPRPRDGSASSESIRGRLAELGGTAEVHSGPDGTEWQPRSCHR